MLQEWLEELAEDELKKTASSRLEEGLNELSVDELKGFLDFEKTALNPLQTLGNVQRGLGHAGMGAASGGTVGGVVGGGMGALSGAANAPEGQQLEGALRGFGRGALTGAATGATLGAAGGLGGAKAGNFLRKGNPVEAAMLPVDPRSIGAVAGGAAGGLSGGQAGLYGGHRASIGMQERARDQAIQEALAAQEAGLPKQGSKTKMAIDAGRAMAQAMTNKAQRPEGTIKAASLEKESRGKIKKFFERIGKKKGDDDALKKARGRLDESVEHANKLKSKDTQDPNTMHLLRQIRKDDISDVKKAKKDLSKSRAITGGARVVEGGSIVGLGALGVKKLKDRGKSKEKNASFKDAVLSAAQKGAISKYEWEL